MLKDNTDLPLKNNFRGKQRNSNHCLQVKSEQQRKSEEEPEEVQRLKGRNEIREMNQEGRITRQYKDTEGTNSSDSRSIYTPLLFFFSYLYQAHLLFFQLKLLLENYMPFSQGPSPTPSTQHITQADLQKERGKQFSYQFTQLYSTHRYCEKQQFSRQPLLQYSDECKSDRALQRN